MRNCESFGGSTNADVIVAQQAMTKRRKTGTLIVNTKFSVRCNSCFEMLISVARDV